MKRYIKSDIIIDLDYPDTGSLTLKDTKEQHSISTSDGLLWRKVYQANDGSFWMKIDKVWREVIPNPTGYLFGQRKSDLRISKDQKDAERIRYEKIKNGGFNPLAEI